VVVGLLCGFVNSVIITRLHVPDLLATLAMDQIYRGIALVLAAGAVLARFPEPIPFIGRGRVLGGIPVSAVVGLVALAVGVVLYRSTHIGRYAAAIGGNREAALLSGINVRRHKTLQYVIMGGAAAIAGILLTGRLNAVQATVGQGLALHTIAAVVVGGTVLFGARHHARHAGGRAAAVNGDERTGDPSLSVLLATGGIGDRDHRLDRVLQLHEPIRRRRRQRRNIT
jgi:ribose transport system permease protein